MRKDQFKRPEPGFSLYEGRTRGKRMKYTFSDDDMDFLSDSTAARRSTRNTGTHTPAEPLGPVVTASGRQIRAPTRLNAELTSNGSRSAAASVQGDTPETRDVEMEDVSVGPTGRPRRSAAVHHGMNGWSSKQQRPDDEYDSDAEDEDSAPDLGDEEEDHIPDDTDVDEEEFEDDDGSLGDVDEPQGHPQTLVVKFPILVKFEKTTGRCVKLPLPSTRPDTSQSAPPLSSRDTASRTSTSEAPDSESQSPRSAPVRTGEEISVASNMRPGTPDANVAATGATPKSILTPSNGVALAFRGSPEKPQHVQRHVDVGLAE